MEKKRKTLWKIRKNNIKSKDVTSFVYDSKKNEIFYYFIKKRKEFVKFHVLIGWLRRKN